MTRTGRRSRGILEGRSSRAFLVASMLAAQAPVNAGDDDGPELSPPAEMAKVAKPAKAAQPTQPSQPAPRTAPAPAARGVLVVPGLTPTPARTPVPPIPEPTDLPALDAPREMPIGPARPGSAATSTPRPLVIESTPRGIGTSSGVNSTTTRPPRTPVPPGSADDSPPPAPKPAQAPVRRARLFGLLPGQPFPPPVRPQPPARPVNEPLDPRPDPAVEATLKRRIEKQAREAVGDRARSLEVRVAGTSVAIQARGVRLLQKRGVRRALETLPATSSMKVTVEIAD